MSEEPFFRRDGAAFVPNPISHGPWRKDSMHGRVVAGLLAAQMEATVDDEAYLPARFAIDLYRMPDLSAAEVTVRRVRDGHRIKLIEAEYLVGGVSMARATNLFLRKGEQPTGKVWGPPDWSVPGPDEIPSSRWSRPLDGMWEFRTIEGAMNTSERRRMWLRDVRELVAGEPLSPFVRAALACDMASPVANIGEYGLEFINSDITLYLHRQPIGDWLGFEAANHQATAGVAIGHCSLYDLKGAIGFASVAALAQQNPNFQKRPSESASG
jgi:acyl-CoA thioesterase